MRKRINVTKELRDTLVDLIPIGAVLEYYSNINPEINFVPFGGTNGMGTYNCWDVPHQNNPKGEVRSKSWCICKVCGQKKSIYDVIMGQENNDSFVQAVEKAIEIAQEMGVDLTDANIEFVVGDFTPNPKTKFGKVIDLPKLKEKVFLGEKRISPDKEEYFETIYDCDCVGGVKTPLYRIYDTKEFNHIKDMSNKEFYFYIYRELLKLNKRKNNLLLWLKDISKLKKLGLLTQSQLDTINKCVNSFEYEEYLKENIELLKASLN